VKEINILTKGITMANNYATTRSNYVELKKGHENAFKENAEKAGFTVREMGKTFALFVDNDDYGCIPSVYSSDDFDIEGDDINWKKDFADHLVPGEVLHLMESGAEKLRYVTGISMFIRSNGKVDYVNIANVPKHIQKFAKKHKRTITECSY
jgi:hypothetical protein